MVVSKYVLPTKRKFTGLSAVVPEDERAVKRLPMSEKNGTHALAVCPSCLTI